MQISVVGLGKLGAPLAAVFASKGHHVIGTDLNAAFVDAVNAGVAPVEEPGLQALIDASRARLQATHDAVAAVRDSDATFIIVPPGASATTTPSRRWRPSDRPSARSRATTSSS
jgi:UDPglucose 6-dehydrogenase